ncbi:sedoheptulose-1,7-bisphosphatase [Chaetomium sp. MPI-SDFR-AT-0129]|nr:sedoheptulose-1,7-bisphosphatase [Chaetomium sp. MPI-SDFR-AT-0129]
MSNQEATASAIDHLRTILPQDGTREALIHSVIPNLLQSIADVALALRNSHQVSAAGTANTFGDDQLNVDVIAENIIRAAIAQCPSIVTASSEEDPIEQPVEHHAPSRSSEQYTLAFDPLDGSSIISANWTVGAIFSLWDGPSALNQDPATRQIASILGVFGPRTTAIVALRVPGSPVPKTCLELALGPATANPTSATATTQTKWHLTAPTLTLAPRSKYFSPANLRMAADDPAYMTLLTSFITRRYTLRYAGGLVPDIVHMLVQGQGVYVSPVLAGGDGSRGQASKPKLRRLYELCPLALVVECAGGAAVDPVDGTAVLAREVKDCGERGGLLCGGREEVVEVVKTLLS